MVLLHFKSDDQNDQFIYECKTTDSIKDIRQNIIEIYNLRLKLDRFINNVNEYIKYGPMRIEKLRGLSHKVIQETMPDTKIDDVDADPSLIRIGDPPAKNIQKILTEKTKKISDYLNLVCILCLFINKIKKPK